MILSMSAQAKAFLILVLWGIAAGLLYDFVRAVRRIIPHNMVFVHAEDLLFWLSFTISVMLVLLWEDNGVVRGFSLLAPIIGLVIYFSLLSCCILKPLTAVGLFIKRIIMVILHTICLPLTFIGKISVLLVKKIKKVLYKFNKIEKRLLKNTLKCEKILNKFLVFKIFNLFKSNRSDKVEGENRKK